METGHEDIYKTDSLKLWYAELTIMVNGMRALTYPAPIG